LLQIWKVFVVESRGFDLLGQTAERSHSLAFAAVSESPIEFVQCILAT
jgi:hypothetical protein